MELARSNDESNKLPPSEASPGWFDRIPSNWTQRFNDWLLFGRAMMLDPLRILIGSPEPISRSVKTSAHNFYIDFLYNFGLIALLPILTLLAWTIRALWCHRARLIRDQGLFALSMVVLFILLVDNNFKVVLRQPYSGIAAYFLWGLLVAMLRQLGSEFSGESREK